MSDSRNIERVIGLLISLADAPRDDWMRRLHEIEAVDLGPGRGIAIGGRLLIATTMTMAAKALVRQMPHAAPESETDLRGVARAYAVLISNELVAAGGAERPYYAREV